MAEGIVYLDVDDEITSAASRIRSAAGPKVALVVPFGSRIATSRMNFRLLSREALVSNKRLSIVSGDAGSRSLAASAGLPVFGSVGEYESSLNRPAAGTPDASDEAGSARPADDNAATAATAAALAASALAASETVVAPPDRAVEPVVPRKSQRPKRRRPASDTTAPTVTGIAVPLNRADRHSDPADRADDDDPESGRTPGLPSLLGGRVRAPILAVIGLFGLAAIVVAVGAYLFLPSASIRLTPRREPIGPIPISVAADPAATTVDIPNGVVPAMRLEVPVEAAQTFDTTGTHVEEAAARGTATFTSENTFIDVTVPRGTRVGTTSGIDFVTTRPVVIPKASFATGPSHRDVGIEAVRPGTSGNVEAGTIVERPTEIRLLLVSVSNADPTRGGTRKETPEVKQTEVDKAVAAVRADIQAAFDAAIAAGADAPDGTTLFPETRVLGEIVVDGDPQSLVGDAIETFDVRVTATGTVIAVDPSPVESIAEARLSEAVPADRRIVDGSVDIVVGSGSVGEDGQVTFEATARAIGVAIVDPAPLRDLVKGRTAADARATLAAFGDAVVTLWPDWVTTVPSMDSRLEITIVDGPAVGNPTPSSSGGSVRPSASRPVASVPGSPPAASASAAP